jgi:putative hydrolase of HD superfamily
VDKAEKHAQERAAMATIAPQWLDLWDLYEAGDSPEAVFVKRMDSLDMAAQAVAYEAQGLIDGAPFVASAERRLSGTQWSTDS